MEGIYDNIEKLPEGWSRLQLGDNLTVVRGASPRPKGDPRYFGGDIPWIMISDITREKGKYLSRTKDHVTKAGSEKSRYLPEGTLILSNSGTVCVPKILAVDGCIHDGFVAFPDLPEQFDILYLYYYFEFIRPRIINAHRQGITQVNLNTKIVKSIQIPFAPLEDQKRIVAAIEKQFSRLDEAVASLKRVKANLKRYKTAVLKAAIEGKLTKEWRKQNPDVEPASKLLERILAERRAKWEEAELAKMMAKGKEPKNDKWKEKYKPPPSVETKDLPTLPRGWVWSNLEQMAKPIPHSLKAGPFGSALKKSFYVDKGYKIYGQEQVIRGDPYYGDYYIDKDRYQSLVSCAVKPGDLLISLVGTIGRVLILPDDIEPGIINPRLVKVSLDQRIITPEYLALYLASPFVKAIFSIASHGGTMDVLNLTILKSVPIPLPPKNEQQFLRSEVDRIATIKYKLEEAVAESSQRATHLRKSVLAALYSGAFERFC